MPSSEWEFDTSEAPALKAPTEEASSEWVFDDAEAAPTLKEDALPAAASEPSEWVFGEERRVPSQALPVGAYSPSSASDLGPRGPAIPGLSISGGQITSLPESLPMEAPPALLANPGRLSRDDLNAALRRAAGKYNRSRDIKVKVQALAGFIRDWDPDKADSLGITRDGYVEPKGFWKVLDFVDVVFDRWLRVAGETLYEGKLDEALATLAGEESDTNFFSSYARNWEEDKGQLGKGSEAVKNWALWAGSLGVGPQTRQQAETLLERDAAYDETEQAIADWMSLATHETAGLFKGRSGAETQRIIEEARVQGSPGAHMMLDLAGFMSVSSLNVIGLGPFKGAMSGVKASAATRRLMGLGLKFNPLGDARMGKLELEAMSQARMSLVDEVAATAGAMEVGATVTKPAQRAAAQASIDVTQAYVGTLGRASNKLTEIERGLEVVRAERADLLGKADKVSEARMAELGVEAEALGARYNKWMTRFDETFNDLSKTKGAGRISGKQLFGGIQARAITIATGEVANATELAFQSGIKSGAVGSRAAPLLSEATEFARVEGMRLDDAQDLWVDAIREGEKSKKVLVDLGLRVKGDKLVSAPTLLSPGEGRVYENARNGAYGSEAKVAAYYPGRGALQKVMGKKKFARRAEEATDEIIAVAAGKGYSSAGRRAIVKGIQKARGTSKAEIAFQADRMVTNVKPMGFALTHAIIKRYPWAERVRHPIAGIASLSFNRPMKYATKGPDGKWVAIEQNVMLHPSMHRRMTAEARQSLTTQAVLRAEWPVWRARLEAMSRGNAELLKVGRFAYEVGWASEEAALATLSDVSKLGAVEKVNEFIDKVSLAGKALKAGEGRTVQVLSNEDVSQVIESLRFLRENTALEGSFFDDIEQLVTKYAGRAGEVDADIALLGEAAATAGERSAFLEDLRIQANILYSAAHASVENRLSFQTNLAIGKMGSDLAPELDRLSKSLASVSEQLAAKKSAVVQTDASKQLDEAIAALAGEGARGEDILKSRDAQANAYKQSLEDFRRSVAAEFGDDVADEAMRGAEAVEDWAAGTKVVDEAGKPLVAYHGREATFPLEEFETRGRGGRTIYGEGAYFSESADEAAQYAMARSDLREPIPGAAPNVVPVYLSIKNPFIRGVSRPGDAAKDVIRGHLERLSETNRGIDEHYIRGKMESFSTGMDTLEEVIPPGVLTDALIADGFDGVKAGSQWVAFEPAQIRSAISPRAPGLTPPAAAAEAAGRRGAMSVEDVAQSYSESVSVAWNNGESVPIRSLFEASWDPVNNRIDATLLGARSTGSIKELNLPKGVQGAIDKLGKARRAIDEATVSLRVAEDIDAGVIGEKTRLAQKALTAAESKFNALLEVASKTVNRDPRFVPGQDKLLYEVGSDQRRILEALQLHYRNNIASITSQIATKAAELRASSREAMTSLVSQLSRSPHLKKSRVLSPGSKERLEKAITQLGESIFGRDVSIKLPAGKDVSADILLKQAVVKARKAKDPAERAAILQKEILNIEEKLAKVGDVVSESQLGKALAAFDVKRRAKKEILPTEVSAFARAVEDHVDEFLKQIDEATFDLRHPDDILRPIEDRITASYNHAEETRAVFNTKLKALRDADLAKLIPTLSTEEAARVSRLVKNPLLMNSLTEEKILKELLKRHPGRAAEDLQKEARAAAELGGPARLLKKFQTQLDSARDKLLRYEGEGVDAAVIEKQRQNVATLEEKIRIIGDPEDFDRVLGVARIMKDFFDESFRRLKEAGVLDEAFDRDEFFARVDVGAYFPHMLSQAARKKLDAFGVGTGGRVGRSIMNYFSQNRQLAGTIEDINDFRRGKRAEQILFHAARNGHYGEGAAQAAADGTETLRTYLNSTKGQSFDNFVREIEEGALLAEYDELFEADPLMVMEYYHRVTSEAVADAQFIDTILELFPAGRFLADLPLAVRDDRAKEMGYVPLGEVEYLQAILQKQLPKGLKGLSKDLKARVVKGASMDEIKALVRAELGEDVAISTDILTALTDPKLKIPYVPIPVREYLNWRNSADALLAKRTTSTEIWDGLQAWAKTQATIVALAHIGRNFIGNTISLLQEIGFGALNFDTQFTAMRIWGSWGDKHLDTVLKIGPHEMSVRDWRDFFSSRGFFDEALSTDFLEESVGFTAKEIPGTEQTAKLLAGTSAGALAGAALGGALSSLIPGAGPLGFFAGGALGLKAGKKWSGVKAVRGGGVYQKFVKNTVKDIKETPRVGLAKAGNLLTAGVGGAAIGSTFLGVGALPMAALAVTTSEDFLKMMSGLNRAAESQARLSMAVGLLKRGEDLDTALVRVNKSLRDYSDLTPLEKNVFRRFFFFYTWEAGNIKYQLNWMKRNPATARGLAAFTNGVYQMQFTEEQLASIPEHYRYGVVVKSGAAKLIAISGLPWQPMLEVLTRSKEGMPIQGLLTRIHPAILTTMEMMVGGGTSFYYGRPIKELNNINKLKYAPPMVKIIFGYPEEPNYYAPVYKNGVKTGRTRAVRKSNRPVMYYLGQKLPGWRWMNQYMILSSETFNSYALESALTPDEVEDARASRLEKGLMFSFGFKETAIDWDYVSYRMSKEMEERMLDMINNQYPMAVGERRYLRKRLSAEPNPTQMRLEE